MITAVTHAYNNWQLEETFNPSIIGLVLYITVFVVNYGISKTIVLEIPKFTTKPVIYTRPEVHHHYTLPVNALSPNSAKTSAGTIVIEKKLNIFFLAIYDLKYTFTAQMALLSMCHEIFK